MKDSQILRRHFSPLLVCSVVATSCGGPEEVEVGQPLSVVADTVAVIGALDGLDHEIFGQLIGVAAHEGYGLFLIDLQRAAVFWYGFDGEFRDALLQRGSGPGELDTPWGLHVDREGLWVLDRGNARISHFTLDEGEGIKYLQSFQSLIRDGSYCRIGDRAFQGGLRDGYTLHEIDGSGNLLRSAGAAPEVASEEELGMWRPSVESQLLRGNVYCAEEDGLVVVAASSHPLVRGFDHGVSVRWEAELSGIHSMGFRVTTGGGLTTEVDPETGANFLGSMIPWNDGTLLLQYDIRMPGHASGSEEPQRTDSRLIDLASGKELARSTELPMISARAGPYLVLLESLPFPRAIVLRLREAT